MTELEELIETMKKLSDNLEKSAENEKIFCHDLSLELERCSWEIFRMGNDLQILIKTYGG
jgi:hypothetical protein